MEVREVSDLFLLDLTCLLIFYFSLILQFFTFMIFLFLQVFLFMIFFFCLILQVFLFLVFFCAVSLRLDIFCLHITSAQITCLWIACPDISQTFILTPILNADLLWILYQVLLRSLIWRLSSKCSTFSTELYFTMQALN